MFDILIYVLIFVFCTTIAGACSYCAYLGCPFKIDKADKPIIVFELSLASVAFGLFCCMLW